MATILTSSHYMSRFAVPAQPGHSIKRIRFLNAGRLWRPAEAMATYFPIYRNDVAHFMNNIPLSLRGKWLVTFESNLPRIHRQVEPLNSILLNRLLEPECLGVVAMSNWAAANFRRTNVNWQGLQTSLSKFSILHPAIAPQEPFVRTRKAGEVFSILFVGNNFARKGGVVALRLAKLAAEMGLDIEVHIVSRMSYGRGNHTDFPDRSAYAEDLRLTALPNVIMHGQIDNRQLLDLMRRCHLLMLATLHDTFGFSPLEGFATGLPAMTSDICAIPEFVFDRGDPNANGLLLHLPKTNSGTWENLHDHQSKDYWDILDRAYTSMARQAVDRVQELMFEPDLLAFLSSNAIKGINERHDPASLAKKLADIYSL